MWVKSLWWVTVQNLVVHLYQHTAEFAVRWVKPHWRCLLFLSTNEFWNRIWTFGTLVAFQNYADCMCVQVYDKEQKCQLYLSGVAVWTFVYGCKWVNIGQFLLLIWPSPVNTSLVHGLEPEPKLLSFHSVMPYNPISVGTAEESGLQWAPGCRRQSHLFTERLHKHTGSRKNLPLIAGNHGNWHQWQETVSWNACAWNLIRAAGAVLEALGEQRRGFFFLEGGGSGWLERNRAVILVRSSGWMLTSRPSSPKRAFLRKKGAIHSIRKLTQQLHHKHW